MLFRSHDFPEHYVPQQYLPTDIDGSTFYQPTENGHEKAMKARLMRLKEIDHSEDEEH